MRPPRFAGLRRLGLFAFAAVYAVALARSRCLNAAQESLASRLGREEKVYRSADLMDPVVTRTFIAFVLLCLAIVLHEADRVKVSAGVEISTVAHFVNQVARKVTHIFFVDDAIDTDVHVADLDAVSTVDASLVTPRL